eukprot:3343670-Rhodomonas_salina.7
MQNTQARAATTSSTANCDPSISSPPDPQGSLKFSLASSTFEGGGLRNNKGGQKTRRLSQFEA